jgi:hypothetical protein
MLHTSMHCITVLLQLFIDLYNHMVISYMCNSTVYVTLVKRLVLRILYIHTVYAFISYKLTRKAGRYSPSLSVLF